MARLSAFDVILGFILASVLARAVNGSAPMVATLLGALVLVLLHRLTASLAFRFPPIGKLVKGQPDVLVRDGRIDTAKLRAHKISQHDLLEEMRLKGKSEDLERIRLATIERNGEISFITRE